MKPSKKIQNILEGIKSEIVAGGILFPTDPKERTWNEANSRAARIIDRYIQGEGLFQLKTKKDTK